MLDAPLAFMIEAHAIAARGRPSMPTVFTRRATLVLIAAGAMSLAACGPSRRPSTALPSGPKLLTVPAIERMVQMGMQPPVIMGEMQKSGTVYNLTTQQTKDLRAVGMPASLISQMQLTYQHALRKNPALANSGRYWTQVDGYWYGGLPLGWPRDWVVGAPAPGQVLR
jgi:hypothetical protein